MWSADASGAQLDYFEAKSHVGLSAALFSLSLSLSFITVSETLC